MVRWTETMMYDAAERRRRGASLAQVGAAYGVSAEAIRRVLLGYYELMDRRCASIECEAVRRHDWSLIV